MPRHFRIRPLTRPVTFSPTAEVGGTTPAACAVALLAVGIVWRTVRYLLAFPIWGDEALLAINFVRLDFFGLARGLENCQVAPLLFVWGERLAFLAAGPSELSMRFLPFLAGVGSLVLFWRLAARLLEPTGRAFAVGYLAVAMWPVSMSTFLKPYSFDLFFALALLTATVARLTRPACPRAGAVLTVVTPVALLASFPAAFVAGGAWLALVVPTWLAGRAARAWTAAFSVALTLGFAGSYAIGKNQLATTTNHADTLSGMERYWAGSFPPAAPVEAPLWFVRQLTGQMTAYPVGATNGGSTLTVLVIVVGLVAFLRTRRVDIVTLLITPFALMLMASAFHKYPFGGSGRLTQHLAPACCLLAGHGLATLVGRFAATERARNRATVAVTLGFLLLGIGGTVRDVIHPYRDAGCEWLRVTASELTAAVPPGDTVCLAERTDIGEIVFAWYWETSGRPLAWANTPPPHDAARTTIWWFCALPESDHFRNEFAAKLRAQDGSWHETQRLERAYTPAAKREGAGARCELVRFERPAPRFALPETPRP